MEKPAIARRTLFGSSGIRGIVGQELTMDLCRRVGQALGTSLPAGSTVCLATDSRLSREAVKKAVSTGLLSTGINVTDWGILPTPALALLTREMGFASGVMLTASHNPPDYNGIKLFNQDAMGYSPTQELGIEELYFAGKFRTGSGSIQQGNGMRESYLSFIRNKISTAKINHQLKLVVDPGNGAASGFASYVFSRLGLKVIPLNDEPDGHFPGRSPEPKEDTLQGTIEFLRQQKADLAICFDGDADRVVFCDQEGFLGFSEMIAFISRIMVQETGRKKVATTVETGRMLDLALADLGGELLRGKVGDVHVAHLARELDTALGVESVGVYIFPELGYYPDSIFAALTLLGHIDSPKQIREFFQSLPPLFLRKGKVAAKLQICPSGKILLNTTDGLRLESGSSWMLIRPSGTEPVIRVIAEAGSEEEADSLIKEGTEIVQRAI